MNTKLNNKQVDKKVVFIGGGDVLDRKQDGVFVSIFEELKLGKIKLLYFPFALFNDIKKVSSISDYMTLLKIFFSKINRNIEVDWLRKTDKRLHIMNKLRQADVIFLSGGDTRFLIDYLHKTKLDEDLVSFYQQGKLVVGNSAGCLAMASDGASLYKGNFNEYMGVGVIKNYAPIVHYNNKNKLKLRNYIQKLGDRIPVYLEENEACLIVNDDKLIKLT